jgi:hypothetical protein
MTEPIDRSPLLPEDPDEAREFIESNQEAAFRSVGTSSPREDDLLAVAQAVYRSADPEARGRAMARFLVTRPQGPGDFDPGEPDQGPGPYSWVNHVAMILTGRPDSRAAGDLPHWLHRALGRGEEVSDPELEEEKYDAGHGYEDAEELPPPIVYYASEAAAYRALGEAVGHWAAKLAMTPEVLRVVVWCRRNGNKYPYQSDDVEGEDHWVWFDGGHAVWRYPAVRELVKAGSALDVDASDLPHSLFAALDGYSMPEEFAAAVSQQKWYPSRTAALDALGRALAAVGEEQAAHDEVSRYYDTARALEQARAVDLRPLLKKE